MKKALFSIVVLLFILHPKITFVQDGSLFHQSDIAPKVYTPVQVNILSDSFDLDDNVIDLTDDSVNDWERKNSSFQNVAYSTIYFVVSPICDHFCKSKWVSQNHFAFESPLFILNRVFRI